MNIVTKALKITTKNFFDIIDITDQVKQTVEENNIQNGFINIFSRHTTTAIKINETEKGFFQDLKKFCQKLVPAMDNYEHNNFEKRAKETLCTIREECLNGHSHILQMFLGTASETVPVTDGKLMLGKWQRILFMELDSKREREVLIQVYGK